MKKLSFEQSTYLVQLMTVLLQLGVIDLQNFAVASIDVADITALEGNDYLKMVLKSFDSCEDQSASSFISGHNP